MKKGILVCLGIVLCLLIFNCVSSGTDTKEEKKNPHLEFLLGVHGTQPVDIQNGLVGWWKLDGNAEDSSGNGLNGTGYKVTPAADRLGNPTGAMQFEGYNSSYIDLGNPEKLNITGALTLAGWFNTGDFRSLGRIISKHKVVVPGWQQVENGSSYNLGVENDASPNFYISSNGYDDVVNYFTGFRATFFSISKWYHLAGVFMPGKYLACYVNGEPIDLRTVNIPAAVAASNTNVNIGRRETCCAFVGLLDDVRVYNRALSPQEIQALYNYQP